MKPQNACCETAGTTTANFLVAGFSLAAGAVLGATAMYLFDPNRGRVRRAKLIDGAASCVRKTTHDVSGKTDDILNRAKGILAKTGAAFTWEGDVDDRLILDRVRSLMGHVVRHAHTVESEVKDGKVTLRGTLPEPERRRLLAEVGHVPGVKAVQDCLACPFPA